MSHMAFQDLPTHLKDTFYAIVSLHFPRLSGADSLTIFRYVEEDTGLSKRNMFALLENLYFNQLTRFAASEVFAALYKGEWLDTETAIDRMGFRNAVDDSRKAIQKIIDQNPNAKASYHNGDGKAKNNVVTWLLSMVLKETGGTGDPITIRNVIEAKLRWGME